MRSAPRAKLSKGPIHWDLRSGPRPLISPADTTPGVSGVTPALAATGRLSIEVEAPVSKVAVIFWPFTWTTARTSRFMSPGS